MAPAAHWHARPIIIMIDEHLRTVLR